MKKILLIALLICISGINIFAEVPNEIRYNGRLKSYQTPVNGIKQVNFKIYAVATGGTALWESGNQNIEINDGIFSHTLTPNIDWRKKDLWLEIAVDNKTLAPREKIMAQAYALHSDSAETLSVSDSEIEVVIGTSTAYIGISRNRIYFRSQTSAGNEYLGVPPGTVIAYAGNNVPVGYMLCDGRSLNISDYPELYQAIGTIYGGSGSTFNLPDFRGMFLRGNGKYKDGNSQLHPSFSTSTIYESESLGILQGDTIRNITGNAGLDGTLTGLTQGVSSINNVFKNGEYCSGSAATRGVGGYLLNFDSSNVVPTSDENRPINYSVNYCIKY